MEETSAITELRAAAGPPARRQMRAWPVLVILFVAFALFMTTAQAIIGDLFSVGNDAFRIDSGGNIVETGNLTLAAPGNGLKVKEGTNARMGQATLYDGKAKVANTSVTANTRIILSMNTTYAKAQSIYCADQVAGNGFDIYGTDHSASGDRVTVVNWMLVEPAP